MAPLTKTAPTVSLVTRDLSYRKRALLSCLTVGCLPTTIVSFGLSRSPRLVSPHTTRRSAQSSRKFGLATLSSSAESSIAQSRIFSGDFAGLSAEFSASTGKLIPIPEHWVPQSLLEWGQAPSALEILVSEDGDARQIVTIFPETGCGVDNLETIKSEERLDKNWSKRSAETSDRSIRVSAVRDTAMTNDTSRLKLEAIFHDKNALGSDEGDHRVRMSVILQDVHDDAGMRCLELQDPVRVALERQVSPKSTHGTIADGGGLDGQRVSRMMGPRLRKLHSFAAEDVEQTPDDGLMTSLRLPGNLTLSYGGGENNEFVVEMKHGSSQCLQVARVAFSKHEESPWKELTVSTRLPAGSAQQ